MNIEVIFKDNKSGQVNEAVLDEMIAKDMISMFRRSEGWAMAGVDQTRGSGGELFSSILMYTGPERRDMSGNILDECAYMEYAA